MGGNFPWGGAIFLGDKFPGRYFPGGIFPGGIFPRTKTTDREKMNE